MPTTLAFRLNLLCADQPNRREKGYKKLKVLDVRGNQRLDYPPPSYLLRADEIGEYLEKLKEVSRVVHAFRLLCCLLPQLPDEVWL